MPAPSGTLQGLVLLTATFALLITILVSPLLLSVFRRRVTVSMNSAAPVATPALSWSMRSPVCSLRVETSITDVTARTVWSKIMPGKPRYAPPWMLSCFDGTYARVPKRTGAFR